MIGVPVPPPVEGVSPEASGRRRKRERKDVSGRFFPIPPEKQRFTALRVCRTSTRRLLHNTLTAITSDDRWKLGHYINSKIFMLDFSVPIRLSQTPARCSLSR